MLREALNNILRFDPESLHLLLAEFTLIHLKKGSIFARQDEYARQIGFIASGVTRAYYNKKNGEFYNKTFFTERSFTGAYSSLVSGQKNKIIIDCLTDCKLWVATFENIQKMYEKHPTVERLARILAEHFFDRKEKREN